MPETDLPKEDEVLRRMLATPPENHKPLGNGSKRFRPKRADDAPGC